MRIKWDEKMLKRCLSVYRYGKHKKSCSHKVKANGEDEISVPEIKIDIKAEEPVAQKSETTASTITSYDMNDMFKEFLNDSAQKLGGSPAASKHKIDAAADISWAGFEQAMDIALGKVEEILDD